MTTQQAEMPNDLFSLQKRLTVPAPISSLALPHAGHLFAGSDDGSLRVYDLSSFKVLKAVRGLGGEVSSILCVKRVASEFRDAWTACGTRMMRFKMDSEKIIQTSDDALSTLELGDVGNIDDVLNELDINASKSHIAFGMDSGVVGVVDLATNAITKMATKHDSICGSVKFIPERAREMVSGGYDMSLLHFDFSKCSLLSGCKIEPCSPAGGMALSPPFIISTAISSSGILAAGTADGRLWIGFGGEKRISAQNQKKAKHWEGLKQEEVLLIKVADGPIVALSFSDPRSLTISTMLGVITKYLLEYEEWGPVTLRQMWESKCSEIQKVNALVTDESRIVVGGFSTQGKGVIEVWKRET